MDTEVRGAVAATEESEGYTGDTYCNKCGNKVAMYGVFLQCMVLTYFGVENLQSEKKERQITDEIQSSMGYIELRRYARLNPRLEAAKQINAMFGLNVQPKFNNFVLNDMLTNDLMEVGADEPLYDNNTTDM